ncbi:MAG TPA: hypothetical protein VLY83_05595 [Methanoregula sp.]|nr:hypothetical protein [Methanoregula sp.]
MGRKAKSYIWESVIGLGFLSGLWTAIGIDPEQVIINAVSGLVNTEYPDPRLRYLFIVLPAILLLVSVYGAYRNGKTLGLVSVVIAYIAGLLVLRETGPALLFLIAAVIAGWIATDRRTVKRLTGR